MHQIVTEHPAVKAADEQVREAEQNARNYAAKVAAARATYAAEQQAALDRGETHSPRLEVIPDDVLRQHLDNRWKQADLARTATLERVAAAVIVQLEQREAELLKSTKPEALQRAAVEIEELRAARSAMLAHHRRAGRRHVAGEWPPPIAFDEPSTGPITAGTVLDAALAGRSLLGARPSYDPGERPESDPSWLTVEVTDNATGVTTVTQGAVTA